MYREAVGWTFTVLIISSSLVSTFSYPNVHKVPAIETGFRPMPSVPQVAASPPQVHHQAEDFRVERKLKEKVDLDNFNDDLETNQISDGSLSSEGGFSWSNLLGMVMQMIFHPVAPQQNPSKSEAIEEAPVSSTSPWANMLSVGLKILSAFLGGGNSASEGIDKVDNGNSPMRGVLSAVLTAVLGGRDPDQVNMLAKNASEFINILLSLLEGLKTSFSQRSMAARNLGRKDSISDASVAGISMVKGYMRSMSTSDSKCMEKYVCEANKECSSDLGQSSLYCHLGSYAVSFILDKSVGTSSFDILYEAGRRGRFGDNCHQKYLECNEV